MSWEQYAPTSESQLGRLSRLKAACGGEEAEAVVRRNQAPPPVPKLGDSAKPAGIATLYKDSYEGKGATVEEVGGGDDKLGEKAQKRGAQLREYAQTCQAFVADIERAVYLLDTIAQQQEQVRSCARYSYGRGWGGVPIHRYKPCCLCVWCEFEPDVGLSPRQNRSIWYISPHLHPLSLSRSLVLATHGRVLCTHRGCQRRKTGLASGTKRVIPTGLLLLLFGPQAITPSFTAPSCAGELTCTHMPQQEHLSIVESTEHVHLT